jgi:hypothetical protein
MSIDGGVDFGAAGFLGAGGTIFGAVGGTIVTLFSCADSIGSVAFN